MSYSTPCKWDGANHRCSSAVPLTETARDVAMKNIEQKASLDLHPMENILLNSPAVTALPIKGKLKTTKFDKLLEVYIDDFISVPALYPNVVF